MSSATAVLLILVRDEETKFACDDPHNECYLYSAPSPESQTREHREGTPFIERAPDTKYYLQSMHSPNDPSLGWVFGSDKNRCDFFLGPRSHGVSGMHFRINHNRSSKALVLTNCSSLGTKVSNRVLDLDERVLTSLVILEGYQYSVEVGTFEILLEIPDRGKEQKTYQKNIERLLREADLAIPRVNSIQLWSSTTVTPMVLSDGVKRKYVMGKVIGNGTTAIVRQAFDHRTGDIFAAKEFSEDFARTKYMSQEIRLFRDVSHVCVYSPRRLASVLT
jgi:hypothetical protein